MSTVMVAEPVAAWASRPKLVVDASLLAASVYGEAERDQAEAQMRGRALCAPALIDYEIANVALSKLRGRAITSAEAVRALECYRELDIERWHVDIVASVRIGEALGLTAYDAAYLWVAGHLRAPLATFDSRVAEAARQYFSGIASSGSSAP